MLCKITVSVREEKNNKTKKFTLPLYSNILKINSVFFLSFMTSYCLLISFPMLPTRRENLNTANILCDRLLPLMSKITKTSSPIPLFNELVFCQIILNKVSLGVNRDFTMLHGGI